MKRTLKMWGIMDRYGTVRQLEANRLYARRAAEDRTENECYGKRFKPYRAVPVILLWDDGRKARP